MNLVNDLLERGRNLRVVDQLNKLFAIDPELTKKLVNTRHPVSKAYTETDEFVYMQETDQDTPVTGLVGVLNGLVIDVENYRLAANYDDDDQLTGFLLLELIDGKFVKAE
jgi:hypothetical protein